MSRGLKNITSPWCHCVIAMTIGVLLLFSAMQLDNAHRYITVYVNRALYYPELPAQKVRDFFRFSEGWILERATLKERVERLETENRALSAAVAEHQLAVPPERGRYIYAKVILRHPEEWWSECRIDKGTKDGIVPGSAVLSDGYLVGRVTSAVRDYAWVQLITASSFMIAVTIEETRDLCILNGDSAGNVRLMYLPEGRVFSKGMKVATSLMNEEIPSNLPIGTVIEKEGTDDGFQIIKVSAGAHMTQLYGVEVYVPDKEEKK